MKTLGGSVVLIMLAFLLGASGANAADPLFERTFGTGVNGGAGFENCTSGPVCQTGADSGDAGSLRQASDVAFDEHGGILVAEAGNNRISRFVEAPDGTITFDRTFGYGVQVGEPGAFQNCVSNCQAGTGSGQSGALSTPWKLLIDDQGRLLVSEYGNDRISRFLIAADGTATFDRAFGFNVQAGGTEGLESCTTSCSTGQGSDPEVAGYIDGPDGIAIDDAGGILIGEYDNRRISRITISADGTPTFDRAIGLDVIPGGSTGFENCTTVTGCQAGPAGETAAGSVLDNYDVEAGTAGVLFAANFTLNRVDVFKRAGDGTISFDRAFGEDVVPGGGTGFETCTAATGCKAGAETGAPGSLNGVAGVESDAAGGLWVTTEHDNRINYFSPVSGGDFAFDYAYGQGVAGGTGPETCRATCVAGQAGGQGGAFEVVQDVTVDPDEKAARVWVSDFDNDRVQVLTAGPRITVTNAVSPGDPASFKLLINGTVVNESAASGGSGSMRVGQGSDVTISETAASAAYPLSFYNTRIDCGEGPVPGNSLTVPGVTRDLDCLIYNTRKPPVYSKVLLQPKKKRVKAGKKVTLKVKVTNSGGTKGTATVRLSSSAKKKARVPKTLKVTVAPGKTVTKSFKVKTRRGKKGRVTIKAKLGNRAAKTVLTLRK